MDSATGCPEDYAELFDKYFGMVRTVVLKAGIAPEDVEDVAMEIIAKFIEKEGLEGYDPNRLHEVKNPRKAGPLKRTARFSSMLRGFAATYVLQHRDKQAIRHRKEPYRLEKPVTNEAGELASWGSLLRAPEVLEGSETSLSVWEAVKRTRCALQDRPQRGRRNLVKCFDAAVRDGLCDGKVDRRAIGDELGVSESTVGAMMREIRTELRPRLCDVGVVKVA